MHVCFKSFMQWSLGIAWQNTQAKIACYTRCSQNLVDNGFDYAWKLQMLHVPAASLLKSHSGTPCIALLTQLYKTFRTCFTFWALKHTHLLSGTSNTVPCLYCTYQAKGSIDKKFLADTFSVLVEIYSLFFQLRPLFTLSACIICQQSLLR